MHRLKILALYFFLVGTKLSAQPSDAQIKKDLAANGILSMTFQGQGVRAWNTDTKNYEFTRRVAISRNSEYAGVKLLIRGDAVYQYMGNGGYKYWKYRVIENSYEGMPNPSAQDIQKIISANWETYYGPLYGSVIKMHTAPTLHSNPAWIWHSINSVEFLTYFKYDEIVSNTEIETAEETRTVRLYRDDPKLPWRSFITDAKERTVTTERTVTVHEMDELKKQTLAFTSGERQAPTPSSNAEIPDFISKIDLAKYIHATLRSCDEQKIRAAFAAKLETNYFISGSTVQLNDFGKQLIDRVINTACKERWKYADQFCENATIVDKGNGSMNISSIFSNFSSNLGLAESVKYKEGVRVKTYRLFTAAINVKQDADATAYLISLSDRSKLCGSVSSIPSN